MSSQLSQLGIVVEGYTSTCGRVDFVRGVLYKNRLKKCGCGHEKM